MANNEDQFAELYRYHDGVVAYLISFGFTREDARDLAQDVFVRVYERMSTYRGEARWGFLKRITRNLALNTIRNRNAQKRSALKTVPADDSLVQIADPKPSPEEQAARNEQLARVSAAISELPPAQRECLLAFVFGLHYEEIAQLLGISVDIVKSRLHEARHTLGEE